LTPQDENPDERVVAAEALAAQAIERYRHLIASSPGLVAGMVQGSTVEEIDASVERARLAYAEISRQVAESYERDIPAANPARSSQTQGAETLTPEAKIALGLRKL
jgi:hypothetical protein